MTFVMYLGATFDAGMPGSAMLLWIGRHDMQVNLKTTYDESLKAAKPTSGTAQRYASGAEGPRTKIDDGEPKASGMTP